MIFAGVFFGFFTLLIALTVVFFYTTAAFVLPAIVGILGRNLGRKAGELKADINTTMVESLFGVSDILSWNMNGEAN